MPPWPPALDSHDSNGWGWASDSHEDVELFLLVNTVPRYFGVLSPWLLIVEIQNIKCARNGSPNDHRGYHLKEMMICNRIMVDAGFSHIFPLWPICSMYGIYIYIYIWLKFMVNVCKYSIYGAYGWWFSVIVRRYGRVFVIDLFAQLKHQEILIRNVTIRTGSQGDIYWTWDV